MILRLEDVKNAAQDILAAIDSNEISLITETLELKAEGKTLFLNVTDKRYYTRVKIALQEKAEFHATVNANLFLKLVTQTTTETIDLTVDSSNLLFKGNGEYKLPLVYEADKLLELPVIEINNVVSSFDIDSNILRSIMNANSKELLKGTISRPVQKMFYVDNEGCITFTSGACVNNFKLEKEIQTLLPERLVKLFRLFTEDKVKFTLGEDSIGDDITQTKVKFEGDNLSITCALACDDAMLKSVPCSAIRGRAHGDYDYEVVIDKNLLLESIKRLSLFSSGYGSKLVLKPYSSFEFKESEVTIYDVDKNNKETLNYVKTSNVNDVYDVTLDLNDLKTTLDGISTDVIKIKFGNGQAIVISYENIDVVIPECKTV